MQTCLECESKLPPPRLTGSPRKFCNIKCKQKYNNKLRKQRQKEKRANQICQRCGVKFSAEKLRKYCGKKCQTRVGAERELARKRAKRIGTCKECGVKFNAKRLGKQVRYGKWCSKCLKEIKLKRKRLKRKKLEKERRNMGLCVQCGKSAVEGYVRCQEHLDYNKEYMRKYAIIEKYQKGESIHGLVASYKMKPEKIRAILIRHNIEVRSRSEQMTLYYENLRCGRQKGEPTLKEIEKRKHEIQEGWNEATERERAKGGAGIFEEAIVIQASSYGELLYGKGRGRGL